MGSGCSPHWRVCYSYGGAFAGQQCQAPNPCLSAPCKNGGTCHTTEREGLVDYVCGCRLGFSGPLCLTPRDHACLASPCLNGGTCDLLTLTEYKCLCTPGWSGEDPGGAGMGWPSPSRPHSRCRAPVRVPWTVLDWARLWGSAIQKLPRVPTLGSPCRFPALEVSVSGSRAPPGLMPQPL